LCLEHVYLLRHLKGGHLRQRPSEAASTYTSLKRTAQNTNMPHNHRPSTCMPLNPKPPNQKPQQRGNTAGDPHNSTNVFLHEQRSYSNIETALRQQRPSRRALVRASAARTDRTWYHSSDCIQETPPFGRDSDSEQRQQQHIVTTTTTTVTTVDSNEKPSLPSLCNAMTAFPSEGQRPKKKRH
jgi:hypothetical protein